MRAESEKPTIIYGLVDPRNQQLRYIGKTVLSPDRRLSVHAWRARKHPHKRHSMAWLLNLERAGVAPEAFEIETIPSGGDWVEAEQFWIAYFRMIGADLCNHTAGGEGQTGYKQPPEIIAKRIRRGPEHHSFGKPQHPRSQEALKLANEKLRGDPARWKLACENRQAAFTDEMKARRNARLQEAMSDPDLRAKTDAKRAATARLPEKRASVSAQSAELWRTKRDQIIAAQNAGKGVEWKRKHSELGRARLRSPDHPLRAAATARRKLTDGDVAAIRERIAAGETNTVLARDYGVDRSTISHIKSGRDR